MLELKSLVLDGKDQASLSYAVRHNVGALKTTLEQTMDVRLHLQSGKVEASMSMTELHADSLEAAKDRMALWCERMAAALRGAVRKEGDLPMYERRSFELTEQPMWLQEAYAALVKAKVAAQTDEAVEALNKWLEGHPMVLVYGLMDAAEAEACRILENDDESGT